MFQILRDVGFLNHARKEAAFCQLLAMSAWHLSHRAPDSGQVEHLEYSLFATRRLQQQINDAQQATTDEALCAVLAFASAAVRFLPSHKIGPH
jgi:hypothetical protein